MISVLEKVWSQWVVRIPFPINESPKDIFPQDQDLAPAYEGVSYGYDVPGHLCPSQKTK